MLQMSILGDVQCYTQNYANLIHTWRLEKKLDSVSLRTTDQMHYLVNNHKELE